MVGNDVRSNDQPVRVGESFSAWRVGHGSIGAPARNLVFITPRATGDSAGRLHVLWAEPPEHGPVIPPYRWMLLETSTLWAAAYERQRGWTRPQLVYSGPISWTWKVTSGAIVEGANDERLIAVPREDGGVLLLTLRQGRWATTTVPVPGSSGPAYVSAIGLGSRRLLATVQADATQQQDQNSVYLYAQQDDGPWRLVRQVQRSGAQAAMEVRLLKGPGARVHLVWRQLIRDDHFVVRHVHSDDAGQTWSQPTDLVPGGLIQNLDATMDGCGRLHVAFEDWSEQGFDSVRIGYATWNSRWSAPERLHRAFVAGDPTLATRPDGSLILAFFGKAGTAHNRSDWRMMYSELR